MEQDYKQITLNEWLQWKEDIRIKLQETAQNFVYIGYRLKQIRDSQMLDGAEDIFEFAQKEYGLGKSTVSRFIAINEKFSEGGNSLELKEEYKRFSSSKLSEMLTLPDSECQLITEKTTVKEIRELKSFDKQNIDGYYKENYRETAEEVGTPLQKCIIDFFQDKAKTLNRVMELIHSGDEESLKEAAELINPIEQNTHKKGIIFLFMYSWSNGVKYKDLRVKEPFSITWTDFLLMIHDIYGHIADKNVHLAFYGEPVKEEPAKVEKKVEETQQNQGLESCCDVATETEKEAEIEPEKEEKCAEIEEGSTEIEEESTEIEEESTEIEEKEPIEAEEEQEKEENTEKEPDEETENEVEEDNEAAVEPVVSNSYEEIANNIREDVVDRIESLNSYINMLNLKEISSWRNIRAKLNNISCDIEQLIKYMDLAEESEEE